ncbi:MAG: hypothetical protein K6F00_08065 [Lachnospiraceae bacterium]|nr:hypothetical protein [Lachnospiraceae bacterium]
MQFFTQDVHVENITYRKKSGLSGVLFVFCIIMAVLMFFLGVIFPPALLLCLGFGGLGYFTKSRDTREYESDYTNGVLDVAVIYGKQSRKELVSIDMENLVVMAPSKSDPLAAYVGRKMKTYDCTSHEEGAPYYCLVFRNPAHNNEEEKLLFEPDEELFDAIWSKHPHEVHKTV